MVISRLMLVVAASLGGSAVAQEIKGGPAELVGKFGPSPDACMSWNRKVDYGLQSFDKTGYTWCGGTICYATIASHRKTRDGWVLRLTSQGNPKGWTKVIKQIDENTFETKGDKGPETLVRCTTKDAIAGIGKAPGGVIYEAKSADVVYAALYAKHVAEHCPALEIDATAIGKYVAIGRRAFANRKLPTNLRPTPGFEISLEESMQFVDREAEYGARADSDAIPTFCTEVLDAFGASGRVLPDLIADPRKKA